MHISTIRVLLVFLVAPSAPVLAIYIVNLFYARQADAEFGGVSLAMFAYAAALIIGGPMFVMARRWQLMGLAAHSMLGGVVGMLSYALIVGILVSSYQSPLLHAPGVLRNSYTGVVIAAAYAAVSSALFWAIAIRQSKKR